MGGAYGADGVISGGVVGAGGGHDQTADQVEMAVCIEARQILKD